MTAQPYTWNLWYSATCPQDSTGTPPDNEPITTAVSQAPICLQLHTHLAHSPHELVLHVFFCCVIRYMQITCPVLSFEKKESAPNREKRIFWFHG